MARKGEQRSRGGQPIQEGGAGRPSLHQEVTDRIIRELEQGRVP
jgi:antirestriction protein ArdC